ncbi:MAG: ABC transporter permease [Dehalococcoidia bacterium]|nr:ABC transporter permease [Dehalococcoidia bacterium]
MKKWLEPLFSAWVGVKMHKLRSSLTMLGIVIGVAAVIALMSIGRGAQADIISNIESMGKDLITINPGSETGDSEGILTLEDATAISEQVPYVDAMAPTYSTYLPLAAGSENTGASVIGTTPDYQRAHNLEFTNGAFFSQYDYQRGAKVAVLGSNVKATLFGDDDPIGQQMRMGNIIMRVTGVLESKEGTWDEWFDDCIMVPLTALQQTVAQPRTAQGEHEVSSIGLTISDGEQTDYVTEEITVLLRSRHQLITSDDDDFQIWSIQEITSTISEAIGIFTVFLGAVAAISLLVGGIGVMNIMLVSVLERTREIGIRKALGARERDIWGQFLLEAAFLSFGGGVIGIALGWTTSSLVGRFIEEVNPVVSPDVIVLAISVSVGIGLFFGFLPAWQASRLNPVEALRAE